MWLLRMFQLFFLVLFVWFMLFDVFIPLIRHQPLFPTIRGIFKSKPAKAETESKDSSTEVKREEESKHE